MRLSLVFDMFGVSGYSFGMGSVGVKVTGMPSVPQNYREGDCIMEYEGYCVKCRTKRTVKDGTVHEAANGRRMAKGPCPECGTTVTRFLSSKKEE